VKTVLLGPPPREVEELIARRRALGQDRFDEVWHGEYHMAPAAHPDHGLIDQQIAELLGPTARRVGLLGTGNFNLGVPNDFRVPDRGFHRARPRTTFVPTAAIVVEIVSPDDETYEKFDFYFAQGVEELLIVDPRRQTVEWYARGTHAFEPTSGSQLLGMTADELAGSLVW
jgi:Uma2 family endonuclease